MRRSHCSPRRCRTVDELSLTVMFLIGKGQLFAEGPCAQIPKLIWAILFGKLTMVIGWTEQFFMEQLACSRPAYVVAFCYAFSNPFVHGVCRNFDYPPMTWDGLTQSTLLLLCKLQKTYHVRGRNRRCQYRSTTFYSLPRKQRLSIKPTMRCTRCYKVCCQWAFNEVKRAFNEVQPHSTPMRSLITPDMSVA